VFIMGGLNDEDHYSKRCLWFKKYKAFYEKCPMLSKRAFFSTLYSQIDCQIYAVGGYDGTQDLKSCEKYSLYENVWREIAPMNVARNGSSCLLLKHLKFLFVMGGSNREQGSMNAIERYDLEFDSWTLLSLSLPMPMHDFQSVILQCDEEACRILVFGGQTTDERVIKRAHIVDLTLELQRQS